jgi:hypothetical protein
MHLFNRRAMVSGAFVLCTVSACGASRPQVEGRVASGGGYLGDWDFYPTACEAWEAGVTLAEEGSDKRKVLLLDRASGKSTRQQKLEVHVDGDTPNGKMDILLNDARCVTTSLKRVGEGYNGTLEVDCDTGEGGRVRGKVTFSNCARAKPSAPPPAPPRRG